MRAEVSVVGYGRTPCSRVKPGEPELTVDKYIAWAADLALQKAGISPKVLIRADQGGASASAMVIRAAAMIKAGIVERVLVVSADTPLSIPSAAPGLPLSPERTRGIYRDFQGPFGVMGASAQFAPLAARYQHEYPHIVGQIRFALPSDFTGKPPKTLDLQSNFAEGGLPFPRVQE